MSMQRSTSARGHSPVTHRHRWPVLIVLHTHLPWLAHHGTGRSGECCTGVELVLPAGRGDVAPSRSEGRRDVLTLGITRCWRHSGRPLPAAGVPHLAWLLAGTGRGTRTASRRSPTRARPYDSWRPVGAAAVRGALAARSIAGVAPACRGRRREVLGPATHPFQPLLNDALPRFLLRTGLDDAQLRFGRRPSGMWAPECGHRPGLEQLYADAGVEHFWSTGRDGARRSFDRAAWRIGDTMSSPSDATSTSPIGCGPPPRAIPLDPTTATSTPTTTSRAFARHGLPACMSIRSTSCPGIRWPRRRSSSTMPRTSLPSYELASRISHGNETADPGSSLSRTTPSCSGTGGTRARSSSNGARLLPDAGVRVTTLRGAAKPTCRGCIDLPQRHGGRGGLAVWTARSRRSRREGQRVQRRSWTRWTTCGNATGARYRTGRRSHQWRARRYLRSRGLGVHGYQGLAASYARDRPACTTALRKLADGIVAV